MRQTKWLALLLVLPILFCTLPAQAVVAQKVRVGYIQSEEYLAFTENFAGIAAGLAERGLITGYVQPELPCEAAELWQALCAADSAYLAFVPEYFYTMKTLGETDSADMVNSDRVDLILVEGTVAGVYMTTHEEKNDYMVFASANPVRSGIVQSTTERIRDNSFAYIDPGRHKRQVDVSHSVFGFAKLGVVYEDSEAAYYYSGIDQVKIAAQENGFALVERHVAEAVDGGDLPRYYADLRRAYAELEAEGIDALYITVATIENEAVDGLLESIHAAGIVTIAQEGEGQVKSGAMFTTTLEDPTDQGRFVARRIEEYVSDRPIDTLEQVYEIVPKLTLNYKALRTAGVKLPFQTLVAIDEILAG